MAGTTRPSCPPSIYLRPVLNVFHRRKLEIVERLREIEHLKKEVEEKRGAQMRLHHNFLTPEDVKEDDFV